MISSFFDGRVRLKSKMFKDKVITDEIIFTLSSIKAITYMERNEVTGSLLIEYDPIKIPFMKLTSLLPLLEEMKTVYENYTPEDYDTMRNLIAQLKEKL